MSPAGVLPFLKWAGGKRWLVRSHSDVFDVSSYRRYVEPFVGSGAVFFALAPENALLSDLNRDLIDTYIAIRDDWKSLVTILERHQALHSDEHFYKVRASTPASPIDKAARFIYLNRTCFNGLYRVNKKGDFNVPRGTKDSVIMENDNFEFISEKLSSTALVVEDFETVLDRCGAGDFVYADPPYTVKHNNNGFIKYNEKLFSWADQERLKGALTRASDRGARIVISNADHPSIKELYADFTHVVATRASVMASESDRRRSTTELLIFM